MIKIEEVTEADIDRICEIEEECFSDPWSKESFTEALKDSSTFFLCAVEEGTVCGYVIFRSLFDAGEILSIAVSESHRRLGIARQMMEKIFSYADSNGVTELYLEVRESNLGAIMLYRCFGFDIIGKRRNYYIRPKENALVMKAHIDIIKSAE